MKNAPVERSDVRRHREQLLTTAAKVFSEHGVHVSLDVVVQESGLSKGTLYRHFPDRSALLLALFDREVEAVGRFGETLPLQDRLLGMLRYIAEASSKAPALAEGWRMLSSGNAHYARSRERLRRSLEAPLAAAQASGQFRPDLTTEDIALIVRLVAIPVTSPDGEPLGEQTLDLLLHGALQKDAGGA